MKAILRKNNKTYSNVKRCPVCKKNMKYERGGLWKCHKCLYEYTDPNFYETFDDYVNPKII